MNYEDLYWEAQALIDRLEEMLAKNGEPQGNRQET